MFQPATMLRPGIIRGLRFALWLGMSVPLCAQAPGAPDAGEDIREVKALVVIPQPQKPPVALWLGIGGGVLLAALAVILWQRHSRRQRRRSPAQIALAALAELAASHELIEAEAFANRAAQAVRQYLADHFGVAAPRRTSEEFLRDLAQEANLTLAGQSDLLRVFLKSCDLAKFAGTHLDATQRGEILQAARSFITATAAPAPPSTSKVVPP